MSTLKYVSRRQKEEGIRYLHNVHPNIVLVPTHQFGRTDSER